ncbi:MAG TPA: hypothetical protein VGW38_16090, partial [Chloroflexota bacterium]|nr:hypothetical protein [Chloroflexota bacterium]
MRHLAGYPNGRLSEWSYGSPRPPTLNWVFTMDSANGAIPSRPSDNDLLSLLEYFAPRVLDGEDHWDHWRITPMNGGANNLVYRARSHAYEDGRGKGSADLAVKFTIRDNRDRAGREYGALQVLQAAGLTIAPRPVFL